MSEASEQLARRNRMMKREAAALTPGERLERFAALQEACFKLLWESPEGWDRFYRRNLRKRAIHHAPNQPF